MQPSALPLRHECSNSDDLLTFGRSTVSSGALLSSSGEPHLLWSGCLPVSALSAKHIVLRRDLGAHGFLMPPQQIRATGEETMELVLSLASFIKTKVKA